MKFTEEQKAGIEARGASLLMSAAAGSGKTSVLVERIFSLITGEQPVDVDSILVVTFTRAAAAEMKERLFQRIGEALAQSPADRNLKRQEVLLHRAQITTIDAFCQYVVKENFPLIDLDPGFRVADSGELKLLEADVMEETLERLYEEGDPAFLFCADYFTTGVRDDVFAETIRSLHRHALSRPHPEDFLREEMRRSLTAENFEASALAAYAKEKVRRVLESCLPYIHEAISRCAEPEGPAAYEEALRSDLALMTEVLEKTKTAGFEETGRLLNGIEFQRLKQIRGNTVSEEKKKAVSGMRDSWKALCNSLREQFFRRTVAELLGQQETVQRALSALCQTVLTYGEALAKAKREAGLIDFNDMEHFALRILTERTEEADGTFRYLPSETAKHLRERFSYVMIDEYQDSSHLQEEILSMISGEEDGCYNRFMVGDVKQSIYRFRLAMPELFMDKLKHYGRDADAKQRRIDLHYNFRSGEAVLQTVNDVFRRLMGEDLGGVTYDADAFLQRGSEAQGEGLPTELLLLETEEEPVAAEAKMVAQRIQRLMRETMIPDKDGNPRPLRYADIVVLLRAPAGKEEIYRKTLEAHHIPVYAESRTGYFSAWEIQEVLKYLSVISNPLDDIALLSVLHSPFGEFTEEELARIPSETEEVGYYFERLQSFAEGEEDSPLREKCRVFLERLTELRERAVIVPVHELLEELLQESGFLDIASAMPFGERRAANLKILLAKAQAYEQTRYRGLSGFVDYIDALKRFQADEGEANVLSENADVVRILSVHKSKGLEFPVVILSDLAKKMNQRDTRKDLLADEALGIGLSFIDPKERVKRSTFIRNVIAQKMNADALGEELRVLYVAMTRAKQKLILTAAVKDAGKEIEKAAAAGTAGTALLPYTARSSAQTWLRWILMTGVPSPEILRTEDLVFAEALERTDETERLLLTETEAGEATDRETERLLRERFSAVYAHPAYKNLFVKTTVTELKQALSEAEEHDVLRPYDAPVAEIAPAFLRAEEQSEEIAPNVRGTVYHKAMELIVESWKEGGAGVSGEDVLAFLRAEEAAGRLMPPGVAALDIGDIRVFLESPLALRMRKAAAAGKLYTERQFMIGIPAKELDAELPEQEMLLVQGVIDCYFEEEGALVLLDYKTDHVGKAQMLIDRYHTQLAYYARALTQITDLPVKERLIYSFALKETITDGGEGGIVV
ncbi:MAG: helicase-exonuclease AddAB subunit AddA [Lachnospiraceae bacterium]|nr:helicase-exonuclease AddAB subunit AddA [Lachnospiraceae bacterium]